MIKEHSSLIRKFEFLLDLFVLYFIPFVLFVVFNDFMSLDKIITLRKSLIYNNSFEIILYSLFVFILIYYLYFDRIYISQRYLEIADLVEIISYSFLKSFFILMVVYLIFSKDYSSIFFYIFILLIVFIMFLLYRIFLKIVLYKIRKVGYNFRQIILVGKIDSLQNFEKTLNIKKGFGIRVVKKVDYNRVSFEEFEHILKGLVVDEVVFFIGENRGEVINQFINITQKFGKVIRLVWDNDFFMGKGNGEVSFFEQMPTLYVKTLNNSFKYRYIKRVIDIVGVFVIIVLYYLPFDIIDFDLKNNIDKLKKVLYGRLSLVGVKKDLNIENSGFKEGIFCLNLLNDKQNNIEKSNLIYMNKWTLGLDFHILIKNLIKKRNKF